MSYILEALRKSEQERNPAKVPDLETYHRHITPSQKVKFPYWILAIVFLAINAFAIYYFMQGEKQPDNQAVARKLSEAEINTPVVEEAVADIPTASVKSTAVQTMPKAAEKVMEQPTTNNNLTSNIDDTFESQPPIVSRTENTLDRAVIPDISELSLNLQRQIPDMDFTTHIYVKDGGSFVIVNGKSISEGMSVTPGLRALQILSDGTILEFKGRRFFMASMTSWQQ